MMFCNICILCVLFMVLLRNNISEKYLYDYASVFSRKAHRIRGHKGSLYTGEMEDPGVTLHEKIEDIEQVHSPSPRPKAQKLPGECWQESVVDTNI